MKYCDKCGSELMNDSKFCSSCGKNLNSNIQENSTSVVICAIVGLLFPIIGAILYYVLKKTDIKAAKTANTCAWIGFLAQLIFFLLRGFSIFLLFWGGDYLINEKNVFIICNSYIIFNWM